VHTSKTYAGQKVFISIVQTWLINSVFKLRFSEFSLTLNPF
jgi:hypothetical protein